MCGHGRIKTILFVAHLSHTGKPTLFGTTRDICGAIHINTPSCHLLALFCLACPVLDPSCKGQASSETFKQARVPLRQALPLKAPGSRRANAGRRCA